MPISCDYQKVLFFYNHFYIYISDLHKVIQHYKVYHFADETNLFHINKPVINLNKLVNHNTKHLSNWLSTNRIYPLSKTQDYARNLKFGT